MTTGSGLAILGIWIMCAACWHSKVVPGFTALFMTVAAVFMTIYLK